jgi:translation initiation factor IF-2
MAKLRVYELAKELAMESREVIHRLNKMGLELKNHMNIVDEEYANSLRNLVKPNPKKDSVTVLNQDPTEIVKENPRSSKLVNKTKHDQDKAEQTQPVKQEEKRFHSTRTDPKKHGKQNITAANQVPSSKSEQKKDMKKNY